MPTLSMNDVVQVNINLSPRATARNAFNLSLIVGTSDVISVEKRVAEFSSVSDMATAGFAADSAEYLAAQVFFAASSQPTRLLVGRQDADNETLLEAITACRAVNSEWYAVMPLTTDSATLEGLAAFIETATPNSVMSCISPDVSLATALSAKNYGRTLCTVSVSAQELTHVAIMGYAMGMQTGLRDSAYTLFAKSLTGVLVDDWSTSDVSDIKAANANCYINRGNTYDLFEPGVMTDGTWFDERINLDKLANDLQLALMDVYTSVAKVAQTEGGVEMLRAALLDPLEDMVKIGFIAPGTWTGPNIMSLSKGDMLPSGYLIQNESIAEQSTADREARLAPAMYVAIKLAGASHSVVVRADVNR